MIHLRELQRRDLAVLNGWRNDRDIVRGLGAGFSFIGPEVDEAWFSTYLSSRQRNVRLAIVDDADSGELLIGCVYLLDISWIHRSAEFAIMIGRRDYWGRGIAQQATREMLGHAFGDLGLRRVWLNVNVDNDRARRLYERVGFRREGTLRASVFKEGRFLDVYVMAILADEYIAEPGE